MTEVDNTQPAAPSKWKKTIFATSLGGVAGFLGAFGFLRLADSGVLGDLGASREIAALVAVIYIITSIAVLAGVASPRAGAKFLNVEDAEELQEQKSMLALSGVGMLAAGAMLIVAALAGPVGPIDETLALVSILGLLVLSVATSIKSSKMQDELMRAVGKDTAVNGFYLLFFVGGGWALASHLELVRGPAPLDWLTMMWAFTLLGAFISTAKHGMMKMR